MPRFKLIWLLICVTGMVIQSTFVTIDYFQYVTTTEVLIKREENFNPPDVSICLDLADTAIDPIKGCSYGNQCLGDLYKHPLKEIMDRWTRNLTATVETISVELNTGWQDLSNVSHLVNEFFDGEKKCIRITLNSFNLKIRTSRLAGLKKGNAKYLSIAGWKKFEEFLNRTNFWLLLHTSNTYPWGYLIEPYPGTVGKYKRFDLTYYKDKFSFLPAPYFSRCRNYDGKIVETRRHCMEICIKRKVAREEPNMAIRKLLYTKEEIARNPSMMVDFGFNQTKVYEYYDVCNQLCPIGCIFTEFEPVFISEGMNSYNHSYKFGFLSTKAMKKVTFSGKL